MAKPPQIARCDISAHVTSTEDIDPVKLSVSPTEREFITVSKGVKKGKARKIKDFEDYNKFKLLNIEQTFDDDQEYEDQRLKPCLSKTKAKGKKMKKNKGPTIFKSKAIKKGQKRSVNQDRHTVERTKCVKCFITHFPQTKFCQWTKSSSVTPQNCSVKNDSKYKFKCDESLLLKLGEHIKFLEMKRRN